MGKKKRVANTPSTRAKEAKDFKQEEEGDEDVEDEPEKELPKIPSSPEIVPEKEKLAEPSTDATDLVSARDKLKNLLQDLIEQSDDSLEDSAPAASEPPPPPAEVTPKAVAKKENKKEFEGKGPIGRRKRRRMQIKDTAFHHTYVMKLFDRSVDLAQFKVHTPLYPICRAWMANQPRNTNLGAKRSPTPEPEEEEEANDSKDEGDGEKEVVKKTYKMPAPLPLPKDPEARLRLKIPLVEKHVPQEVDMDMEVKPSKEVLLREHLDRWGDVRRSWHATGHKNEERFAESAAILRAIFKRAQSQEAE